MGKSKEEKKKGRREASGEGSKPWHEELRERLGEEGGPSETEGEQVAVPEVKEVPAPSEVLTAAVSENGSGSSRTGSKPPAAVEWVCCLKLKCGPAVGDYFAHPDGHPRKFVNEVTLVSEEGALFSAFKIMQVAWSPVRPARKPSSGTKHFPTGFKKPGNGK